MPSQRAGTLLTSKTNTHVPSLTSQATQVPHPIAEGNFFPGVGFKD